MFFAGKLIWKRESWWQRILHNETAFQVQRRLQWKGLPDDRHSAARPRKAEKSGLTRPRLRAFVLSFIQPIQCFSRLFEAPRFFARVVAVGGCGRRGNFRLKRSRTSSRNAATFGDRWRAVG